MARRWSHLTWFKVLVLQWCNFSLLSSDWSVPFLVITQEPFVLLTGGWSHLTCFKVLVIHWCNFGHLSSDWSIPFLSINRKLFVVETCGWCHFKLRNVLDIFFLIHLFVFYSTQFHYSLIFSYSIDVATYSTYLCIDTSSTVLYKMIWACFERAHAVSAGTAFLVILNNNNVPAKFGAQ